MQFFLSAMSSELFLEYFNYETGSVFFQEILVEVNRYEVWTGQKLLDFTGGQEIRDSASEASDS